MNARRIREERRVAVAVARESSMRSVAIRVAFGLLVVAVALGVLLAPSPAGAVDTDAGNAAKANAARTVHVLTPGHGNGFGRFVILQMDPRQPVCRFGRRSWIVLRQYLFEPFGRHIHLAGTIPTLRRC